MQSDLSGMVLDFVVGTNQRLESIYSRKLSDSRFCEFWAKLKLEDVSVIIVMHFSGKSQISFCYFGHYARTENTIQQKKAIAIGQLATNIKELQETSFQNHVCPTSSLRDVY